ncbi:MAG: glycosyltransferase family 39 protein [Lentisphaeria bacterium]|nr:glycosyltransferase family 39 protein [Lentisphaeria bacterium]
MDSINRFFDRLTTGRTISFLVLCAFLLSFYHLSGRWLYSGDEIRVAGIIRGMLLPGPVFLPQLNGIPFLEYPPLYYWGGAFFMSVFGVCDASAKAMSATALAGSILLTYALARRLNQKNSIAFFAAIMLGFSISFFAAGRTCTVDILLGFFVLLAVFAFYSAMTAESFRSRLLYYLLYSAGSGCAIMTKGLLGLALPGIILFFLLLIRDISERKIHWREWLALGLGSLAALVPVVLWAVKLYNWLGFHDFYEVMYSNNIGRFTGSQTDHAAPFYYYLERLPQLFQPWLVFLPFGLWHAWRKFRRLHDPAGLFLLCAFLAPMLLFTLASGKRQLYLIPVYPAATLLETLGLFEVLELLRKWVSEEKLTAFFRATAGILLAVTAVGCLVLCFMDVQIWSWAVPPFLAGSCAFLLFLFRKYTAGWTAFILAFCLFVPFVEGVLPNRFNRDETLEPLFRKVSELEKEGRTVYLADPMERTRGAAVYYLGKCLPVRRRDSYDGKSPEIWIFRKRDKKIRSRYGDHHHLVQMPEGTEL